MTELDDLRARVAAAERVCHLVGITGARMDTDRDKALTQAWSEWNREHRGKSLPPTDAEIETLAARRVVIGNNTRVRLDREARQRLDEECRMTVLEAVYERQHEPEVYAAHVWGDWVRSEQFPDYEMRDCADQACLRRQTRRTA